jgi:hypothetical protein
MRKMQIPTCSDIFHSGGAMVEFGSAQRMANTNYLEVPDKVVLS